MSCAAAPPEHFVSSSHLNLLLPTGCPKMDFSGLQSLRFHFRSMRDKLPRFCFPLFYSFPLNLQPVQGTVSLPCVAADVFILPCLFVPCSIPFQNACFFHTETNRSALCTSYVQPLGPLWDLTSRSRGPVHAGFLPTELRCRVAVVKGITLLPFNSGLDYCPVQKCCFQGCLLTIARTSPETNHTLSWRSPPNYCDLITILPVYNFVREITFIGFVQ